MPINRVELVKKMLPDAIRHTPRDTYIYDMDGETQAHASYREAATTLAKELGLGERPVSTEEVHRRMGKVKVVYTNVEAMQRHTKPAVPPPTPANGNVSALTELRAEITAREARGKRGGRGRQQRSIAVELPQSAITELLRSGRAKVMLRVKTR